jgi:hypothetical protein
MKGRESRARRRLDELDERQDQLFNADFWPDGDAMGTSSTQAAARSNGGKEPWQRGSRLELARSRTSSVRARAGVRPSAMRSACLSVIYIMVLMDFVMPPEDLVLPVTKIVSLSSALPDVIGSRELKNPHKHDLGLFEQGLFDDKADRLLDLRGVLSLCSFASLSASAVVSFRLCLVF